MPGFSQFQKTLFCHSERSRGIPSLCQTKRDLSASVEMTSIGQNITLSTPPHSVSTSRKSSLPLYRSGIYAN